MGSIENYLADIASTPVPVPRLGNGIAAIAFGAAGEPEDPEVLAGSGALLDEKCRDECAEGCDEQCAFECQFSEKACRICTVACAIGCWIGCDW